jgi:hypothetical protein
MQVAEVCDMSITNSRMVRAGIVVATLAAFVCATERAQACSGPPCWPGSSVPKDGVTVPANLPAITWVASRGPGAELDASDFHFELLPERVGASTPVSFTLERAPLMLLIKPSAELLLNRAYRLSGNSRCDGGLHDERTFRTAAAAPLPTTLGETVLATQHQAELQVSTGGGQCYVRSVSAQARVGIRWSESAKPWQDALLLSTWVDGEEWSPRVAINESPEIGSSWVGHGADILFTNCGPEGDPGLAAGTHTVQFRATLAGTDVALESEPVSVELRCATRGDASTDASNNTERDASTSPPRNNAIRDDDGGCHAAPSARSSAEALSGIFAALGLCVWLRRRRRSA